MSQSIRAMPRGALRFLPAMVLVALLAASASTGLAAATPIDFTGFAGSGFAPEPLAGQLDSDLWRVTGLSDGDGAFGGLHDGGDFARGASPGGVSSGGVYAFDVGGGNTILGTQPTSGDFTPGTFTLKIQNGSGATIDDLYVAYQAWVFNDQDRSSSLTFAYSLDDAAYVPVPEMDLATPEAADATPAWAAAPRSTVLSGLSLADGEFVYLQWTSDDLTASGSRDEIGIDDVEVRADGPNAVVLRALRAGPANPGVPLLTLAGLGVTGTVLLTYRRQLDRRNRRAYQSPAILYAGQLEAKAGSPLGDDLAPDTLDLGVSIR